MIVHPTSDARATQVIAPTRCLDDQFGLVGATFEDPKNPRWTWTVLGVYSPIPNRTLPGVRTLVVHPQSGVYSFYNQRDLEVAIGMYSQGDVIPWMPGIVRYPGPHNPNFYGACLDNEDIRDLTQQQERMLRQEILKQQGNMRIPAGYQLKRRLHMDYTRVVEETIQCLGDNLSANGTVDMSLDAVERRWRRTSATPHTSR